MREQVINKILEDYSDDMQELLELVGLDIYEIVNDAAEKQLNQMSDEELLSKI